MGLMPVFASPCPTASRPLFYHPDRELNSIVFPGFADSLELRLQKPLAALGYCISEPWHKTSDSDSGGLGLLITASSSSSGSRILATVLQEKQLNAGLANQALRRPLAELDWDGMENGAMILIFSQKIAENLRVQYVAEVTVQTQPAGAVVKAENGLEGKAPLEWVLPLGMLSIEAHYPGYLPRQISLDISKPGDHTVSLPLTRRRFYHSKFFPVAAIAATGALGAYVVQNYYYGQYQRLGIEDQRNRPDRFGELFHTAQTWEKASSVSLGLAILSLGLSFRF